MSLADSDQYLAGYGGARSVMVTIVENGHGDSTSSPKRGCLHFT